MSKDSHYNHIEKPPTGGSSHYSFDSEGRLVEIYTPADPRMNMESKVVPNPSPELIAETHEKITKARELAQRLVFDPQDVDIAITQAADRVWLEDNGIDPDSMV
ncbi:MAG: hypothetical protein H6799_03175 [Candidatus Nomurabacteria bacterium]|nr:MAG: hypothetical protein H6799_03175 [Candidatus Nomurabacteria bacterium]HRV75805.1 hypothetical protein [Candidatus Saccharimonadales bacterium]